MSSNQTINLNGKMFYNTEYLKHICPAFFHGCAKSHRLLISKKNISEDNYIYATYAPKSLKWKVSNSEVKSAKVLLDCANSLLESVEEKMKSTKDLMDFYHFNQDYSISISQITSWK